MKSTRIGILFIVAAMVFSACAAGKVSFTRTGEKTYPPYTGVVKVLKNPPAEGTYTEIGIVSSEGDDSELTWAELIEKIQEKAAAQGADAIVIEATESKKFKRFSARSIVATAIRTTP